MESIKKYLGSGYDIEATMGHVRDLPKSSIGVEIDNDFEPKSITIRGKRDRIVAGLIRQEKDGTVRVEGGSYESQERVVIIVKRCHENFFQG